MLGYTSHEVFRTLDDVDPRAYLGLGIASAAYYVQYVSNVRTGFRDRKHATPVAANMWNFADDITYVFMFNHWFGHGDTSHWFTKALWFGMCAWATLELITHYQTIKYSLSDLFPGVPRTWALGLYAGAQLSLIALFAFLVQILDDPLWLIMIATTQFSSIIFAIPMLLGRGNTVGISRLSARSLIFAPSAFLIIFFPAIAPGLNAWPTYALGVACLAIAVAYNVLLAQVASAEDSAPQRAAPEQSMVASGVGA